MLLEILNTIDSAVWGPWLLILLLGVGVLFTIRLGLIQITSLPRALKLIFFARNRGDGDIDSFKALCTALAATVGTGNIVGVATAIKAGGPGALNQRQSLVKHKHHNRYIQNVRDLQHHQIPADDPGQCGERDKFHWTSSSLSGHEYLDYIKSACRMQGKPS